MCPVVQWLSIAKKPMFHHLLVDADTKHFFIIKNYGSSRIFFPDEELIYREREEANYLG